MICPSGQELLNQNAPQFEWRTVVNTDGFDTFDFLVQFSRPYRTFVFTGYQGNSIRKVFLHFTPLRLGQGSGTITPTGLETWIPCSGAGISSNGHYIRFSKPIQQFYIDMDRPFGGGISRLNILATDAIKKLSLASMLQ